MNLLVACLTIDAKFIIELEFLASGWFVSDN